MKKEDLQHLSFYLIAISTVVILFNIVANYGEKKLKAPVNMSGIYHFISPDNIPQCLASKNLTLNLEQSGIYLFAGLAIPNKTKQTVQQVKEEKIDLNGKLQQDKIVLTGNLKQLAQCQSQDGLGIEAVKQNNNLIGKIISNNPQSQADFVAKIEKKATETGTEH